MVDLAPAAQLIEENRSGLKRVQIVAVLLSFSMLIPYYVFAFFQIFTVSRKDGVVFLIVSILLFPFWAPSLWILHRLKERDDLLTIKLGLAFSAAWASFTILCSAYIFVLSLDDLHFQTITIFTIISAFTSFLLFSSVRLYVAITRDQRDWTPLQTRISVGVLAYLIVVLVTPNLKIIHYASDEAAAVGSLRTITMAQLEYAERHPEIGYASTLAALGPLPGESQIDASLASGMKSNYKFTLFSEGIDSLGKSTRFHAAAIPVKYTKDVNRTSFVDESGVIRYTTEHRPATVQDPALQ